VTGALDAVVDAAIERALVDGSDARRYFALAGALERARADGTQGTDRDETDGSGTAIDRRGTRSGPGPAPRTGSEPSDTIDVDRLGAALVSTVAVRALEATRPDGIDADAWVPGDDPRAELVATGARLALRRFETDAETVAARAGVPRERLLGRGPAEEGRCQPGEDASEKPNGPRE
jgi:hypothetical protein